MVTGHATMIALGAPGRPHSTFGDKGFVDLTAGLRRPPIPR
jgi:hypothetical protein